MLHLALAFRRETRKVALTETHMKNLISKNSLLTALLVATITAVIGVSKNALAQTLNPGMWHAQTDFKVDGIPLPSSTGDSCVTPDEAKDAKTTLTKNLDKIGCVITDWKVVDSQLKASLNCKNDNLTANGTIEGVFTETSYELNGKAHGFYEGIIPSVATLNLHGQWTGACPNM